MDEPGDGEMIVYLDANVVQYCADYGDFVFRVTGDCAVKDPALRRELEAIRDLVEIEQFGSWEFATSPLLLDELKRGRPTPDQSATYATLSESFAATMWPDERDVDALLQTVVPALLLKSPDGKHLASALAMGASWFITNDSGIIQAAGPTLRGMRIAKPSDCVKEIGVGLFLR